jgi:hypothetical protein
MVGYPFGGGVERGRLLRHLAQLALQKGSRT